MARNNRPTGVFKRQPEIDSNVHRQYTNLSKADWCDVFFDMIREFYLSWSDTEIMAEAVRRHKILEGYRKHEARQEKEIQPMVTLSITVIEMTCSCGGGCENEEGAYTIDRSCGKAVCNECGNTYAIPEGAFETIQKVLPIMIESEK